MLAAREPPAPELIGRLERVDNLLSAPI